jgi:uncharacterized membrane protein
MFLDAVLAVLGMCILPLVTLSLVALPIVALVRTVRISRRLDRLEAVLARRRRHAPLEMEPPGTQEAIAESPARDEPRSPTVEAAAEAAGPEHEVSTLEAIVGGRALGWIAVGLLVLAAAFFLRLVIERGMIGELGRVTIGLAAGVGLCGAGYAFARRGWRTFSQMLTAAGVALLYLMTFATFGFYHLIPQAHAQYFLIAIIAESLALAVLYESPVIALMAVVGGLLAPVLLRTDEDRYVALFTYLVLLDAGAIVLVLFRDWWASATVALLGTHAIFWAWYVDRYHPVKLPAALAFHATVFLLFLAHTILGQLVRGRPARIEALIRLMLNAGLFAAAAYVLLDPDYGRWMGTAAVGMAIVYAVLAWLTLAIRPNQATLLAASVAVSMGFTAIVFPLQADAAWIAVGWAVQGLALWGFGLRIRSMPLRGLGAVFLTLGAGRLLFVDTLLNPPHAAPFVPLFNGYGLPALAVAACVLAAAALAYERRPRRDSPDFVAMRALSLIGFGLLGFVASVEAYDYFITQIAAVMNGPTPDFERQEQLRHSAQMALSIVWALYAVGVLLVGFRFSSKPLRWLALAVLAVTLGKVVAVDTQVLAGFYRVTAYLVLALVMGAAAWAYQKVKRALLPPAAERSS